MLKFYLYFMASILIKKLNVCGRVCSMVFQRLSTNASFVPFVFTSVSKLKKSYDKYNNRLSVMISSKENITIVSKTQI